MAVANGLRQDLRSSLHLMRKHPALTAAVVVSLGLTLGANTAVFGVLHAFLLRPLAIVDIDRVVRVRQNMASPGKTPDLRSLQGPLYGPWRDENRVFSDIAAGTGVDVTLTGGDSAEHLPAALVSANFFPVLGIQPLLGRNISPDEDLPGGAAVVLLSYDLWQRHFAADPGVLGRRLRLNGVNRAVIGVMPRGLHHPYEAQLWLPLGYRGLASAGDEYYAPARLKPGVTLARARREMNDLAARLWQADPRPSVPRSADLSPMRGELVHNLDQLLYLLAAGAALVLLIACVNVANLLLAQGLQQAKEAAVRMALGATRLRIVRQALTHSALLALLGSALGAGLAALVVRPLAALSPAYGLGEFDIEPRIDVATLAFAAVAALVVALVCGLLPAWRVSRGNLGGTLKAAGRATTLGRSTQHLLGSFVVAEVALSLMLLVGAGLVLKSFRHQLDEYRGFDVHDTLAFATALPAAKYPLPRQRVVLTRAVLERLRVLPGVVAAGATTTEPLFPGTNTTGLSLEGHPAIGPTGLYRVHDRTITPGYLESLRVPLIAGRLLTEHDDENAPAVALISQSMANRYWPGHAAIGQRLKRGPYDSLRPWVTIVGIVGTLKETEEEPLTADAWYVPYRQSSANGMEELTFTLRTRAAASSLVPLVRQAVNAVDKEQPIYDVSTMEERLARGTTPARFSAFLYSAFGFLGLVLVAIGIYGVIGFVVDQQLPEMGVRAALGASPGELRLQVLRFAIRLAAAGLALGLGAALLLGRLLASQLYQIAPHDPWVIGGALACVAGIIMVACHLPASRAAGVDPASILHQE